MKKIFLFVVLFAVNIPLFSSEEILDSLAYCYTCLQKEEDQFLAGEQCLYEKLLFVQNTHDVLLDFLNTATEENFYHELQLCKPFIERMSEINNQIFSQIYPDRFYDRRLTVLDGIPTYIYFNTFSKRVPLTDEERTLLYEGEVNRHNRVKLLPKQRLNKDSLKKLVPGQTYNFVLTLENKVFISYNQRYKLKNEMTKTVLCSPNHTILAGNAPVLSAGVINYYQIGKKKLFVLSCSSGHFHPLPEALISMKKFLIDLGVPEEAIICLSVSYDKMEAQMNRIKEAKISSKF